MAALKIALIVVLPAMASAAALAHSHEHIVAVPMFQYKQDCGTKSHFRVKPGAAAMLQVSSDNVPGAGIDFGPKFKPFETVLKDGFLQTDCIKDYMYYRGDKFGDNKFDYKLGPVSNVSIVHYDQVVAKEDQEQMTQKVCFEFCRTVPNMGFFGIVNGRNCYCTPYFEPMASDSSQCDAVCEGEPSLMCGGKSKSSMFTMHMCADTKADLEDKVQMATELSSDLGSLAKEAKSLSNVLQTTGEKLQAAFGNVGDSVGSNLAQDSKVWAGDLIHSADDAEKLSDKLMAKPPEAKSYKDAAAVTAAESFMEDIDEFAAQGELKSDELTKQIEMTATLKAFAPAPASDGAAAQYYPAMYFVDKEYTDVPSTCNGDVVGKTRVGSKDECASMCDAAIHSCVGFFYGKTEPEAVCTLLSSFKEGFYYTACKKEEGPPVKAPPPTKGAAFLQSNQEQTAGYEATCYAKLSKFEGTTLKPDPSGKCEQCFKDLTKADRCPW